VLWFVRLCELRIWGELRFSAARTNSGKTFGGDRSGSVLWLPCSLIMAGVGPSTVFSRHECPDVTEVFQFLRRSISTFLSGYKHLSLHSLVCYQIISNLHYFGLPTLIFVPPALCNRSIRVAFFVFAGNRFSGPNCNNIQDFRFINFYPNATTLRSGICYCKSVCRPKSVCNVGAPYSEGWSVR